MWTCASTMSMACPSRAPVPGATLIRRRTKRKTTRRQVRGRIDRGRDAGHSPAVKVATWRGGPKFTIDDVEPPVAGPGQAVVAVHAAGICGTDVHATQGLFPWAPPMVMGHEYTGIVQEVGRGVSRRL